MPFCKSCRTATPVVELRPASFEGGLCIDCIAKENELLRRAIKNLEDEKAHLASEWASALYRNGLFRCDVMYAAFGHRQALMDEQIIQSLRDLRDCATKNWKEAACV